jgi:phospholipid/cholesterol/gamma-HCH transport system permease protein
MADAGPRTKSPPLSPSSSPSSSSALDPAIDPRDLPLTPSRVSPGITTAVTEAFRFTGGVTLLLGKVLLELPGSSRTLPLIREQLRAIGVNSLFLVAVTALATGSVMALQLGYAVEKFGGTLYVPRMVTLSIVREMGPVFTGLLVAGRVGAGIASEVGSMQVTQQVDAIRALGTSPIRRLVIPRLGATLIALPLLTLFANTIAILGALLISSSELGIAPTWFLMRSLDSVSLADLMSGLVKSLVFGAFLGLAGCWKGLATSGGTREVGESAQKVVVACCVFILIVDLLLTRVFILTVYPP